MDYAPRRDSYGYDRNGGGGSYNRRSNQYRQPRRGEGGGYGGSGGWGGWGGERRRKGSSHRKQSNDPDPKEEWRRSLRNAFVLVGDFSRRTETSLPIEDNVKSMVVAFAEQGLLEDPVSLPPGAMAATHAGDPSVVDMVVEAAESLGMQSSIYALFTALASLQNGAEQFSVRVLDGISKVFLSAFSKGAFIKGELCNCGVIDGHDFGCLLQGICGGYVAAGDAEVLQVVAGYVINIELLSLERVSICQPVKDLVCYVVLAVLPWCGPTLKRQWSSGLDSLIEVLGFHMENRLAVVKGGLRGTFVQSISKEGNESGDEEEEGKDSGGDDDDDTSVDSVQMLWALVRAMHKQGWKESSIPKSIPQPWRSCAEELSNVNPTPLPDDLTSVSINQSVLQLRIITSSSQDAVSGGEISSKRASDSICHAYTLYVHGELELFDEDSGPEAGTIGSLHPKERLMLSDFARDVLACMQPFIQTDGIRIGSFSSVAEQLLSIGKLAPQNCCIEYLIIELMLQALLIVPQPPCWCTYIQRVLLELCRVATDTTPRALAFTTGMIFHEIPAMDTSVILLYGNWFGYYLKDISTNWPLWSHWTHLVQANPHDPQRIFLCVALQKFAKLSQPDRVRDSVPEEFWPLALLPDPFDSVAAAVPFNPDKVMYASSVGGDDTETQVTPDLDPTLDTLLLSLTAEKRSEISADEGKMEDKTNTTTLDIPGVVNASKNSFKHLVSILEDENNTSKDVHAWMNEQASIWGEQNDSTVSENMAGGHSFELYYGGREMEVVLRAILRAAGPNPLKVKELLKRFNNVVSPLKMYGNGQKNERNVWCRKLNPTLDDNETQQAVQMSLLEVVQRAWPTREEGGRHNILSSHMFHSTVDALLAEGVVSPLAVRNYAFSSSLDNCVYDVLGGGWDLLDAALYHAKKAVTIAVAAAAAAASDINRKVNVKDTNKMTYSDAQLEDGINDKSQLDTDDASSSMKAVTLLESDEVQLCSELILRCTDVLPLLSGEKRFIAGCLLRRVLRWCLSNPAIARECLSSMSAAEEHGGELSGLERSVLNFAINEATAKDG